MNIVLNGEQRGLEDTLTYLKKRLDDALEDLRGASSIPDTLRVDHGHRTLLANSQAVCLGTVNATLAHKAELVQALFQIAPRFEACFLL